MDPASPAPTVSGSTRPIPSTAADEIAAVRAAFVDAFRNGDARALAELYGEDARLLAPEAAPLRGRYDVAAFWQVGVDIGITDVELEPEEVEVLSPMAWEVGRYTLRLEPDGTEPIVEQGRYLLIYALETGGWLRAAEMFAPHSLTAIEGAARLSSGSGGGSDQM